MDHNLGDGLRDTDELKMIGSRNSGIQQQSIDVQNNGRDSLLQESRQKIKESVEYQNERLKRLESSQIKARIMKNEMETLEDERRRIEMEKRMLLQEKDQETEQWKARYQEMTKRNDEIIENLTQANQSYLTQVSENEKLSRQIEELQM